jgi:hypothetical protein
MDEFKEKNGLIVNFWNDDIMFVTQKMKDVDSKKYHNNIKTKNKKQATIKLII